MLTNQLENIHQDTKDWNRLLELMTQECVYMKNRLSSLLDLFSAPYIIEWAEHLQNHILTKEEAIDILKFDLRQLEMLILHHPSSAENDERTLEKQSQIRESITYLENDCQKMRKAFNDFISSHLFQ